LLGGATGYTTGLAIADSGKLAGPWRQQAEPVFAEDGGHAMIFRRFDGQLMLALHQPNNTNHPARLGTNRGPDGDFSAAQWKPRDSGLLGPVTLTPLAPLRPK
jgi:hypothetical protein